MDDAAIPGLRKLKEIKLPRHGYGNILHVLTLGDKQSQFDDVQACARYAAELRGRPETPK